MPYIVVKAPPRYHQVSVDEFLFEDEARTSYVALCETETITRFRDYIPGNVLDAYNIPLAIRALQSFNETHSELFEPDRTALYHTFYIPKRSGGGVRRIDQPLPELMNALYELRRIFESMFHADMLYHTTAHAYIHKRSTVTLVRKHQQNASKWFAHYDFHNFFGSVTPEFLSKMFSMIYPFSAVMQSAGGKAVLEKALSLCFLNGGLPQGTPISPMLTNILMIPFDHKFSNHLEAFGEQNYVYTRYADDISISSRSPFDYKKVEAEIAASLKTMEASLELNRKKTSYGNNTGSNWMFGMMLNSKNNITVGWKNVKAFRSTLNTYLYERSQGRFWPLEQVRSLSGTISYYKMIDEQWLNSILDIYNQKYKTSVRYCLKQDQKRKQ
jgi:RNA-directed DNA polymerase